MQIFFIALLCYVLYRFIVGFVIPLVRTARQMKRQFREMTGQQTGSHNPFETTYNNEQQDYNNNTATTQKTTSGKKGAKEDYIDFEEFPSSKN